MNKEWSELNKKMQSGLKKKDTFEDGIDTLLQLRAELWNTIMSFKNDLTREELCAIPFVNADGYHSKTIAYSLWHIFRIEDIVAHTLIKEDDQVFFTGDYQRKTGSPIITTGNELHKMDIAKFSEELDIDSLYAYIKDVKESTEEIVKGLPYEDLKRKISDETREVLQSLNVVSSDESAVWLIDYWCGKDVRGLIQMPFSRHWIMHIEACLKIRNKVHPAG